MRYHDGKAAWEGLLLLLPLLVLRPHCLYRSWRIAQNWQSEAAMARRLHSSQLVNAPRSLSECIWYVALL